MSKHLTPSAFFHSPRAAKSAQVVEEESFEAPEAEEPEACEGTEGYDEGCSAEAAYDDEAMGYGAEEGYAEQEFVLHPNQLVLTLSYTLLNQVRQTARAEGVNPEDFILELVAEGITRRAFEDAQRTQPSHLMTRTGYVPPEADGFRSGNNQFFGGNHQNGNFRNGNQNNQQRRFNGNGKFNGGNNNNGNRFNRNNNNGNGNGNQKNRFDQRNRKNGNNG